MSDARMRELERGGELTIRHMARHGRLVGAQVKTENYGGWGGMAPGVWEIVRCDTTSMEFGKVGKLGKLLKAGPGKRYVYSIGGERGFSNHMDVLVRLGATLHSLDGEQAAKAANARENAGGTWAVRVRVWEGNYWADGEALAVTKSLCTVSAPTKRRAQAAVRREFGVRFSGRFGAFLTEDLGRAGDVPHVVGK